MTVEDDGNPEARALVGSKGDPPRGDGVVVGVVERR